MMTCRYSGKEEAFISSVQQPHFNKMHQALPPQAQQASSWPLPSPFQPGGLPRVRQCLVSLTETAFQGSNIAPDQIHQHTWKCKDSNTIDKVNTPHWRPHRLPTRLASHQRQPCSWQVRAPQHLHPLHGLLEPRAQCSCRQHHILGHARTVPLMVFRMLGPRRTHTCLHVGVYVVRLILKAAEVSI